MIEGKTERYEVGRPIGSGGMATVHLARRQRDGAAVAIKRLHPHLLADAGVVRRFREESSIAARVRSPNVVPVHEVIELPEGPALVLDYVEGESLMNLLYACWNRGDTVPLAIASAIVVDLLTALEAAHTAVDEAGAAAPVIHRDVSPHNVLVGFDGVAKLSDFGIARVGQTGSTQEGQLKGKLGYLAPELLGGQKVGPRSDLYGAGVVLWELLAGQKMLEGSTAEILSQILGGDRAPPSAHCDAIPGELDALVMRSIATDPARRFASARTMAEALRTAAPPSSRAEVGAWVRALAGQAVALRALQGPGDEAPPPSSAAPTRILSRLPQAPHRSSSLPSALVAVAVLALVASGAFVLGARRSTQGAGTGEPVELSPESSVAASPPTSTLSAAPTASQPSASSELSATSAPSEGLSPSAAVAPPRLADAASPRGRSSAPPPASAAPEFDQPRAERMVKGQANWVLRNCPPLPNREMWRGAVRFRNDGTASVTRASFTASGCIENRLAGLTVPPFKGASEEIGVSFFWPPTE